MKIKLIFLVTLTTVLSANAFSKNTEPVKQEEKKTTKSKYDFNIFKLISIERKHHQTDSTKSTLITIPKRKED